MAENIFKKELIKCGINIYEVDVNFPVVLIGTLFSKDNEKLIKKLVEKQEKIIYCSSMEDTFLHVKNFLHVKYEIGAEVGLLALLAKQLFEDEAKLCEKTKSYLDEFDDGYLSAESNVGDEEIEEIITLIKKSQKCTFLFGEDIYNHPNINEIVGLLSIITNYENLHVSLLDNSSHVSNEKHTLYSKISELESYDGTIVYVLPNVSDSEKLFGSAQFGIAAKLKDKDIVNIEIKNKTYKREFCLKNEAKGTVAVLPLKEDFEDYRFQKAKIKKDTE